jgi:choline dehydrogenase-like flavoprotein
MAASFKAEILVIGSGPGGAITACLLAEHGRDVLLVEDGPNLPLESCGPFSLEEMVQKYRCGGLTLAFGKPKVPYVEGCCVGGGSEINSGLYHRPPPEVLEQWQREYDLEGAAAGELEPHCASLERDLSVCTTPGPTPLASRKLEQGARQLGWRVLEVPRWFRYDGTVGPDGVPRGARQSMTNTFVPRALAAGCRLLPNTRACRLIRDGLHWQVRARRPEGEVTIAAETVFVAAGAVQTPFLLLRSGIHRNVGRSLALHPTVKIVACFDEEVNHEQLGVPVHQVKEFAPRMSFGCSISSPPYLALALIAHQGCARDLRRGWRQMAIYYAAITGDNTGRVRVLPGLGAPMVTYRVGRQGLRDLATALRRLGALLFAAGARRLYPCLAGAPRLCSPGDLSRLPAALPGAGADLMTVHLFSSCPMGERPDRCAANSFGKVHGVEGLYVNDASLLCTAPGVNPQGTVMAFARRNVLHFLRKL